MEKSPRANKISPDKKHGEKERKKGKREGGLWHVQDEIFLRVY